MFHTERELTGTTGRRRSGSLPHGYADICLEPFLVRFTDMRHGYLIELKYLKRSAAATETRIAAAAREAQTQLRRYLADERLARQYPSVRFTGLAIVFHGWELAHCDAVTGHSV